MTPDEWLADFEANTAELQRNAACGVPKVGRVSLTCALGCCGFVLVDQATENWLAAY
ncbi:hypothetical protein C8D88_12324 [Lentzea atacamensis]|uniref:Uncharacterized protein n=1 Tax=Lentzea atacamensis TaxID=531938 RepID=A0A316HKV4_9PSEU|nr:hypothetical protein C8D88_12324 [Lentzea atacamensis]